MALTFKVIASGVGRNEGPVIRPNGEIVFTAIDQGKVMTIKDGKVSVLGVTGHSPVGLAEGIDGTIYATQTGSRSDHLQFGPHVGVGGIQSIKPDGTVSWLTQDPIAPNDLCIGPDGFLWVTDPTRARPARDDGRLFRVNLETGEAELVCSVPWYPNGIGIGLDDALYVARSQEKQIVRFALGQNGKLGKEELYAQMPFGRPDGFAFDVEGNCIVSANSQNEQPGQVQVYDRNGKLIETILPGPGKRYANVALGTDKTLIINDMDGGDVLSAEGWPHPGVLLYPFRKAAK